MAGPKQNSISGSSYTEKPCTELDDEFELSNQNSRTGSLSNKRPCNELDDEFELSNFKQLTNYNNKMSNSSCLTNLPCKRSKWLNWYMKKSSNYKELY